MCLAVPGKIISTRDDRGTRMATVSFDGIEKEICLAYLPDIEVGDYVIVHVGFAISQVDEASALETLKMFKELGILEAEVGMNEGPSETTRSESPSAESDEAEPVL
jgi:hydrogenase expression/formation protein HypC